MSAPGLPTDPAQRHQAIANAIIDMSEGESLRQVAQRLGISHTALRLWLLREVPDQYREAQELGRMTRVIEADNELDDAPNHIAIARAREKCKFTRWDLERLEPRFSPKQEISGPGGGPIQLDSMERAKRLAFANELSGRQIIDITPEST